MEGILSEVPIMVLAGHRSHPPLMVLWKKRLCQVVFLFVSKFHKKQIKIICVTVSSFFCSSKLGSVPHFSFFSGSGINLVFKLWEPKKLSNSTMSTSHSWSFFPQELNSCSLITTELLHYPLVPLAQTFVYFFRKALCLWTSVFLIGYMLFAIVCFYL